MPNPIEQTVLISVKSDGTIELTKVADQMTKVGQAAGAAGERARSGLGELSGMAAELKRAFLEIAAPVIATVASIEGLKRAIGNSDYVRDLAAQMRAVTGSTTDAAKAMVFFEESSKKTRETADDLSKTFAELFTLAQKRGFSQDMFQDVTVQLAQFAAATGHTVQEISDDFRQILSGTPRAQGNTILTRLGLTPTEVTNGVAGAKKLMEGIRAVAKEGENAGQTFASAGKKISDAFLSEFAKGFNAARGEADKGLQGLVDAMSDPKVSAAIQTIGEAFAKMVPIVIDAFGFLVKGVKDAFSLVGVIAGGFVEGIGKILSTLTLGKVNWTKDLENLGKELGTGSIDQLKESLTGVAQAGPAAADGVKKASKAAADGAPDFSGFKEKVEQAVKALLGVDEASRIARAALQGAFASVQRSQGTDAAVRAFGDQLIKLGDIARDTGIKLSKALQIDIGKAQAAQDLKRTVDAATAYQQALEALIPTAAKLGQQQDLLVDAFDRMRAAGLSDAEIADQLGSSVDSLAKDYATMGFSTDDADKRAKELFQTIRDGREDIDRATQSIRAIQDALQRKVANIFANMGLGDLNAVIKQIKGAFGESQSELTTLLAGASTDAERQAIRSAIKSTQQDLNAAYIEAGTHAAEQTIEALKEIQDSFSAAGDVFRNAATDAGADFGTTAITAISEGLKHMGPVLSKVFGTALLEAFGGKKPERSDFEQGPQGDALFAQASKESDQRAQQISGAVTQAFGLVVQSLNTIKNAQAGKQVDVGMSVISGALAGASIGSAFSPLGAIIGAIVGALIGGITAAIANAKAKAMMAWADFGIENGIPFMRPDYVRGLAAHFDNVTSKELHDFFAQVAKTMDDVTTGFVNLILKFPAAVLANLPKDWASLRGLNSSPVVDPTNPDFNSVEFLKNFEGNLQLWVENKLPQDIAEHFKDSTSQVFEAMGMTAERFDGLWTQLQGMDPKQAMQVLNDTADALITFDKVFKAAENLKTSTSTVPLDQWNIGATGEQRAPGQNDFMYQLAQAESGVAQLAETFAALPFAEQAAAAKALAGSVDQVMSSLVTYLNQIAQIAKSIAQDVASRKLDVDLDQAKGDKVAQSHILEAEYDKLVQQIRNAYQNGLNPQEIQALYQKAADIAGRAYALDPTAEAAKTYKAQLDYLAAISDQQLKAMANQAQNEVDRLLALVRPFADFLKGDVTGAMTDLDAAANSATGSLTNFGVAMDLLAQRLAGPDPFGQHTGGVGGGNPNTPNNPTNEPPFIGHGTPDDPYRANPNYPGNQNQPQQPPPPPPPGNGTTPPPPPPPGNTQQTGGDRGGNRKVIQDDPWDWGGGGSYNPFPTDNSRTGTTDTRRTHAHASPSEYWPPTPPTAPTPGGTTMAYGAPTGPAASKEALDLLQKQNEMLAELIRAANSGASEATLQAAVAILSRGEHIDFGEQHIIIDQAPTPQPDRSSAAAYRNAELTRRVVRAGAA